MAESTRTAETAQPWTAHEWPCPGFYVGNHHPFTQGSWSCTCNAPTTAHDGYELSVCRCDGGPYLGARKSGTPCCCERCGFITENQRAAIVEGNDRMHRALGQAKDRQLLMLERRIAAVREALPDLCFITRSASPLRCTSWVGGTFANDAEFTVEMCCLPCRVRAALALVLPPGRESD